MENVKKRGFASMNKDRLRELASKGGKMAHLCGTAHQFTSDEAREAGRKGGMARAAKSFKKLTEILIEETTPVGGEEK